MQLELLTLWVGVAPMVAAVSSAGAGEPATDDEAMEET